MSDETRKIEQEAAQTAPELKKEELSEKDLDQVAGGAGASRVKTADKQQKAVLDFIKG